MSTLQGQVGSLLARFAGVSRNGNTLRFSGMNMQIVSGSGATNGDPTGLSSSVNGLGNLIIGYNESPGSQTGSHNLVLGNGQTFTSYGGVIAGEFNTLSGPYSSVTGGQRNTAFGYTSSVTGGFGNTASGDWSSVIGGYLNRASGGKSSVTGGQHNTASGDLSSVIGGYNNTASGNYSTERGGKNGLVNVDYDYGP